MRVHCGLLMLDSGGLSALGLGGFWAAETPQYCGGNFLLPLPSAGADPTYRNPETEWSWVVSQGLLRGTFGTQMGAVLDS